MYSYVICVTQPTPQCVLQRSGASPRPVGRRRAEQWRAACARWPHARNTLRTQHSWRPSIASTGTPRPAAQGKSVVYNVLLCTVEYCSTNLLFSRALKSLLAEA